ncbi:EamA family transporter [Actinotalea sp. JY-7885]|uniref:EamA family transporter n=1 Tax=Actinotalea sp. JY-7885 TaxID=2758576 RepID=UPI00165EA0D9|nr:EamA family transporter [Actinotalea sp. JY-7885]
MSRLSLLLVTAVAPAVWGTTYATTTLLLPPDRPLLAATLRALPAGLLLLAVGRRLPRGSWWWRATVLGALNIGVFFALLFLAAYRLPGGVAATLGAVQPLVVAGLSALVLHERVRARTVVAGLVGVVGVALLVLRASARLDTVGVVAGLVATGAMALGLVLTRRWGRPVGLLTATAWQLTAGGLLLVPVLLVAEGLPTHLTGRNLAGFAYLTLVGTALAYALWFRGLERLSPTHVSFLGLLSPLVATAVGVLALGERLTPWQVLGAALALAGLVAAQLPSRATRRATREAAGAVAGRGWAGRMAGCE